MDSDDPDLEAFESNLEKFENKRYEVNGAA